jgi:hypothetical protein
MTNHKQGECYGLCNKVLPCAADCVCPCHSKTTTEHTGWYLDKAFDEAIRPFVPQYELYLVPNINRTCKIWAMERKTEEVKALLAAAYRQGQEDASRCKKNIDGNAICGVLLDCHIHDWRAGK